MTDRFGVSKLFTKLTEHASRVETWMSLATTLSAAGVFTWLAGQWSWISDAGWPAIATFVTGMTSLCVIAASGLYLAINTRRRLALARFNAMGLYVGDIGVSDRNLESDYCLEITFRLFNATGDSIELESVDGRIGWRPYGINAAIDTLPHPAIRSKNSNQRRNLSEFSVSIEQRLPGAKAVEMARVLEEGKKVELSFSELRIGFKPIGQGMKAFYPTFDDVTVQKGSSIRTGRIARLSAKLKVGAPSLEMK